MQPAPSLIKASSFEVNAAIQVIWEPIPGSQELAIDCNCRHVLYDGTRGPGKTLTQLMRFRRFVGIGYGAFWRGIIFDREYKNLGDLVNQSKRFFNAFGDGAKFLSSAQEYKWVWPSGEELLFRHAKKGADYDQFHGHEYPFIGWNELTKHPTSELYDKMMSCNRSSYVPEIHAPKDENGLPTLGELPMQVFSTTNSTGPGRNWVKMRFIDVAQPGQIVRTPVEIFNPRTQKDEIIIQTQVRIFGSYRENIYLPPEYIAELNSITDENLKRSWLYGDWDVVSGGAFDDLWKTRVHVKPRFVVPDGWKLDRSFDWGSTHPFSVQWWAEANGEEAILPDGSIFCPVRGSLIMFFEWYGSKTLGTNKGLKMSPREIAKGIIEREINMMESGWITSQPWAGPADNQIENVNDVDTDTIKKRMAALGVAWTESDKAKGSRKMGLQLFRDMLENALTGEGPGIYFMGEVCRASITLTPTLPRDDEDPDDIDTTAEDHPYDATRYRILKNGNRIARRLNVSVVH